MLFQYMEMLYRYVKHNAETMGFMRGMGMGYEKTACSVNWRITGLACTLPVVATLRRMMSATM